MCVYFLSCMTSLNSSRLTSFCMFANCNHVPRVAMAIVWLAFQILGEHIHHRPNTLVLSLHKVHFCAPAEPASVMSVGVSATWWVWPWSVGGSANRWIWSWKVGGSANQWVWPWSVGGSANQWVWPWSVGGSAKEWVWPWSVGGSANRLAASI